MPVCSGCVTDETDVRWCASRCSTASCATSVGDHRLRFRGVESVEPVDRLEVERVAPRPISASRACCAGPSGKWKRVLLASEQTPERDVLGRRSASIGAALRGNPTRSSATGTPRAWRRPRSPCRALRRELQHRVARVPEEHRSPDRPSHHRFAVEQCPFERLVDRTENGAHPRVPPLPAGRRVVYR